MKVQGAAADTQGEVQDLNTVNDLLVTAGCTECDFTNYARKNLSRTNWAEDDTNNWAQAVAAAVVWTAAGGATNNTILGAFFYDASTDTNDTTRLLISVDWFAAGLPTNGGDVTYNPASGLYRVPGTLSTGNATVTAQPATLTLTAIPGTPSASNATVTAQVASLALTAIPGTLSTGGVTVTAQVATLTLTAVPGTVLASFTKTAQTATVTLTAVPGSLTPGAATITAQPATLTLTAVPGTLTGGAVTFTAQIATLTLTAVPGTIALTAALPPLIPPFAVILTAVNTYTVSTTPQTSTGWL